MQANVWDPTKEKLQRRPVPSDISPIWRFKAEWGIPRNKRKCVILYFNDVLTLYLFQTNEQAEVNSTLFHIAPCFIWHLISYSTLFYVALYFI